MMDLGPLSLAVYGTYLWSKYHIKTFLAKALGESCPAWQILYQLRGIYRSQRFYDKEEVLYRLALFSAWTRLPKMYPSTLVIVGDLAYAIAQQNGSTEALQWYTWALRARTNVLGKLHPATTGAINGLGLVREMQGRLDEALEIFIEAYQGRQRRLGSCHDMANNSFGNILNVVIELDHVDSLFWAAKRVETILHSSNPSAIEMLHAGITALGYWTRQGDCESIIASVNRIMGFWQKASPTYVDFLVIQEDFVDVIGYGGLACTKSQNTEGVREVLMQGIAMLENSCSCIAEDANATHSGAAFSRLFY